MKMKIQFIPVKYKVTNEVSVVMRNDKTNMWAIVRTGGQCLNKALRWEWEQMPSNRDDAFLRRTRFTLQMAKRLILDLYR